MGGQVRGTGEGDRWEDRGTGGCHSEGQQGRTVGTWVTGGAS